MVPHSVAYGIENGDLKATRVKATTKGVGVLRSL